MPFRYLSLALKSPDYNVAASAFESLVTQFGRALQKFFGNRLCGAQRSAEEHKDCEQTVWAALWESARNCSYNPDHSSVDHYLWGIARNVLRKHFQSKKVKPAELTELIIDELIEDLKAAHPPIAPVLTDLKACLISLKKHNVDWFAAVILYYYFDLSVREIAKTLDIGAATATVWKNKGLEFLKKCLQNQGWSESYIRELL